MKLLKLSNISFFISSLLLIVIIAPQHVIASVTIVPASISTAALVQISDLSDIQIIGAPLNGYTNACVYTNAGNSNPGDFKIHATASAGSFTLVGFVNPANTLSYSVDYYDQVDKSGASTNLPYDDPKIVNTTNDTEPTCSTIGDNASIEVTVSGTPVASELYRSTLTLMLTAIP